jgi:hypothetical protein
MRLDHSATRARWHDDIIERLKLRNDLPCQTGRSIRSSGVESRLTAARLRERHLNGTISLFQQLDGGKSDLWSNEVHETRNEEPHARRRGMSDRFDVTHVSYLGRSDIRCSARRVVLSPAR